MHGERDRYNRTGITVKESRCIVTDHVDITVAIWLKAVDGNRQTIMNSGRPSSDKEHIYSPEAGQRKKY